MKFAWEKLGPLIRDGLEDLLYQDFREVEVDQDTVPMAPDWPYYFEQERIGTYRVISARLDGELVGHNAFFVNKHTRHKGVTFAINDMIYMAPEHRKGWAGIALIRESERLLKEAGVVKVQYSIKLHVKLGASRGTVGDLLAHLGYRHIEDVYAKIL